MSIKQTLGANVRRLREQRGWSQEEFADRCGIHRTYISGVERGRRNPTVLVVAALAQGLDVPPSALLESSE